MPSKGGITFTFNVVWTGRTFDHLQYFVASQLAHSDARVRFIANACPPDQLAAMEAFGHQHPGRLAEVLEVSSDRMIRHGEALDRVAHSRDDGDHVAFIDPDILARGPFLARFRAALATHDAVTSGKEVWSDHNVRPSAHPGISGEHFFDVDGYVFGSPHLAIYRREALLDTMDRWQVGFGTTGNDIPDRARARLEEVGRSFWIYDTGKVVNILFQEDGHRLRHDEEPGLLHVGGVAHFLAPPSSAPAAQGRPPLWGEGPDWGRHDGMAERYRVARFTAEVLQELCEGRPAPSLPDDVDATSGARLALVREALVELIETHGPRSRPAVGGVAR